jgi:hypothetical protein
MIKNVYHSMVRKARGYKKGPSTGALKCVIFFNTETQMG